ncbi:MAG: hypothetical protein ACPGGK_18135 [Pikeienuella sp.]
MKTDKIAIVTMAHGHPKMLAKWCAHYGANFGPENLFILSHGSAAEHAPIVGSSNLIALPRVFDRSFGRARVRMVGRITAGLLEVFQRVIITDVDEFICVSPSTNVNLRTYLAEARQKAIVAPMGFHLRPEKTPFDWSRPALTQRSVASFRAHACKPTIITSPQDYLPGFHAVKAGPFEIDPNLMSFHLKHVDHEAFSKHYNDLKPEVENNWNENEKSGVKKSKPQAAWADANYNWQLEAEKYDYQTDPNIVAPAKHVAERYEVVQHPEKQWWAVRSPKVAQKPFSLPLEYRNLV